jgi:hypothetical protein
VNEKREREIFGGDDVDETADILSELNVIAMCSEPNRCANLVHRLSLTNSFSFLPPPPDTKQT